MNAATLLALLASAQAQAPADAARPAVAPDPVVIQLQVARKQLEAPGQPAAVMRMEVRRFTLNRNTTSGSRSIKLESRPEPPAVEDSDSLAAPEPAPPRNVLNIQDMVVARENFDEWVFAARRDDRDRMAHLGMRLRLRIGDADLARALGPEERRKLELAGAGDIQGFLNRVQQARADFERARQDYSSGVAALNAAAPLAEEFERGPFGEGSLFAKTLRKVDGVDPAADEVRARTEPPGRAAPAHELDADRQTIATALAAGRGPNPVDPAGPRVFTAQVERGPNTFFPLTVEPRPGRPRSGAVEVEDVEIRSENFDPWVVGLGAETLAKRREFLAVLLDRRIARSGRERPVPPDLDLELRRAGGEDAQQLLDRIEARRADFERDRRHWDTGLVALRHLEPLAAEFRAGPYGPGSRFAAALEAAGR